MTFEEARLTAVVSATSIMEDALTKIGDLGIILRLVGSRDRRLNYHGGDEIDLTDLWLDPVRVQVPEGDSPTDSPKDADDQRYSTLAIERLISTVRDHVEAGHDQMDELAKALTQLGRSGGT